MRVRTATETFEEIVSRDLHGMRVDVERVPIDRVLAPGETPPGPRAEGQVMVIPVFEEIVVVEKKLVLKEELRITQATFVEHVDVPIELRRQSVSIERLPANPRSNPGDTDE